MLTSDLLVANIRKGRVYPSYLDENTINSLIPVVEGIINIFKVNIGNNRETLQNTLKIYDKGGKSYIRIRGLIKLLMDRCEFTSQSEIDPYELRKMAFKLASEERYKLSITENMNRDSILNKVAMEFKIDVSELENLLYSDLPSKQILKSIQYISPIHLLNRYNLALVQAILYKATKVTINISNQSAHDYRRFFRFIKFYRLIYDVHGNIDKGYEICLDGPFSLFQSIQKYGLQLAMFLPILVSMDNWTLEATLQWGKSKSPASLKLDSGDGLVSHYNSPPELLYEEISIFYKQFTEQDSDWLISDETEIIDLKGKGICVPDFVFTHKDTAKKIFMEVFGYWSRDLVWKRLEMIEECFPSPLLIVISKKLRISEGVVEDNLEGDILVYSSVISVKEVIKRLETLCN